MAAATLSSVSAIAAESCGDLVELGTRGETITYSFRSIESPTPKAALVLLAGGHGYLNLDENGCARKLKGNTLVRNQVALSQAGYATAVVDASSDHHGKDGLGGFRTDPDHGEDIAQVVSDLRTRTGLPVYIVGISRGTISAINAAVRLNNNNALAGTMLLSPVTSGRDGGYKAWVAQTVFDLPLEDIEQPLAVVVHRDDKCIRTPPKLGAKIVEQARAASAELVTISDGSDDNSSTLSVKACRGNQPHGFVEQDAEVREIITKFVDAQK